MAGSEAMEEVKDLATTVMGDLAEQMQSISAEVERVQNELSRMKLEVVTTSIGVELTGDSPVPPQCETQSGDAHGESPHPRRVMKLGSEDSNCAAPAMRTPDAQPARRTATSVLRRRSVYDSGGKRETMGKGGIRWSPSVRDNAKGPGEDSLSDMIKKRSLRSRNARRRADGEGSFLGVMLVYILFVFVLSNLNPRVLQHFMDMDTRGPPFSSRKRDFGGGTAAPADGEEDEVEPPFWGGGGDFWL